jgi:ClpP class serine protease
MHHSQSLLLRLTSLDENAEESYIAKNTEINSTLVAETFADGTVSLNELSELSPDSINAILVIRVNGGISLEDDYGTTSITDIAMLLDFALEEPRISGVVMQIESPGGSSYGIYELADKMIAFKKIKPIVSHYNRMTCSAGVLIGCCATESFINHRRSTTGSIGAAFSMLDFIPFFETMGLKYHYVNAPMSKSKNKGMIDLREGDYSNIKIWLEEEAGTFVNHVKQCRPSFTDEKYMDGVTFNGEIAVQNNLVDGIASLDDCISRCSELSTQNFK